MAKYDHGGGCACGLQRYCDCGVGYEYDVKYGSLKGYAEATETKPKKTTTARNPDDLSEVIGFLVKHEEYRLADLVHHAKKTLRTV